MIANELGEFVFNPARTIFDASLIKTNRRAEHSRFWNLYVPYETELSPSEIGHSAGARAAINTLGNSFANTAANARRHYLADTEWNLYTNWKNNKLDILKVLAMRDASDFQKDALILMGDFHADLYERVQEHMSSTNGQKYVPPINKESGHVWNYHLAMECLGSEYTGYRQRLEHNTWRLSMADIENGIYWETVQRDGKKYRNDITGLPDMSLVMTMIKDFKDGVIDEAQLTSVFNYQGTDFAKTVGYKNWRYKEALKSSFFDTPNPLTKYMGHSPISELEKAEFELELVLRMETPTDEVERQNMRKYTNSLSDSIESMKKKRKHYDMNLEPTFAKFVKWLPADTVKKLTGQDIYHADLKTLAIDIYLGYYPEELLPDSCDFKELGEPL